MTERSRLSTRGVALLAVLWLTMAISLIAFSTAYVVRTESAAASNQLDAQRAYFMARGGIERAIYEVARASRLPASEDAGVNRPGRRWLEFSYTQGRVLVEVVPENAKLSINGASPDSLTRLFELSGKSYDESAELARAIVDWRSSRSSTQEMLYDQYYASVPLPIVPNFSQLEDLEEILFVKGMSREFFYNSNAQPNPASDAVIPCLPDLLSVLPGQEAINLNFAAAQVMATLPGWDLQLANLVAGGRNDTAIVNRPYRTMDELASRVPSVVNALGASSVTLNAGDTYTLIASGRLANSKLVRTVRAVVRFDVSRPAGYQTLGWWDDWPWSGPPEQLLSGSQ